MANDFLRQALKLLYEAIVRCRFINNEAALNELRRCVPVEYLSQITKFDSNKNTENAYSQTPIDPNNFWTNLNREIAREFNVPPPPLPFCP